MTTEELFEISLSGPGLLGFSAQYFINADLETKREFLLSLKQQIPEVRENMIAYYGNDFVDALENYF